MCTAVITFSVVREHRTVSQGLNLKHCIVLTFIFKCRMKEPAVWFFYPLFLVGIVFAMVSELPPL